MVAADHQHVWRDRAGQAFCATGTIRHDAPVNRTLVERSPLLPQTGDEDQWGRPYQTYDGSGS